MIKEKDTNRIAKVNAKIQKELGFILLDFLEGKNGLVTITRVETSADMKWAKVWISIFGGDDDKILKFLNAKIYQVQGELNRGFTTKIIPRIQFFLDTTPRYVQHVDELIKKIHEEEEK